MSKYTFFLILSILFANFISATDPLTELLMNKVKALGKLKTMAIAGSDNESILESCRLAKDLKVADCLLVGNKKNTEQIAKSKNIDISDFQIIDVQGGEVEDAKTAVKIVHDGKADMFCKGSVETKTALQAVLNKEYGLRRGALSSVSVFHNPDKNKLLFMTDATIRPSPDLEEKVELIQSSVELCEALGVKNPKIAPLAAIEFVNPKMPATVEADELTKMNDRGEIKNCIVDGPLSLDLALDPEAARLKKITSRKIQGDADVLLFPDLHAANIGYKMFTHVAKWAGGNVITGTSRPVVVPSRSDTKDNKLHSILLAALYADYLSKLAK